MTQEGEVIGKIQGSVDPYLLTMLETKLHCSGDDPYPMLFSEQKKSMEQMELIGEKAKEPNIHRPEGQEFTISERETSRLSALYEQQTLKEPVMQNQF